MIEEDNVFEAEPSQDKTRILQECFAMLEASEVLDCRTTAYCRTDGELIWRATATINSVSFSAEDEDLYTAIVNLSEKVADVLRKTASGLSNLAHALRVK